MAIVNVLLPDTMKRYIEERVSEGGYSTTSEYVRDLIREDQKRRAEERLEALLLEGLASPASEWTKEDVDHIKKTVRERLASKQPNAMTRSKYLIFYRATDEEVEIIRVLHAHGISKAFFSRRTNKSPSPRGALDDYLLPGVDFQAGSLRLGYLILKSGKVMN